MHNIIKDLNEENAKLQHKVKGLEIHNRNHEAMIRLLKRHKEELKALVHHITVEMTELPIIAEKRRLDGGKQDGNGSK